MEYLKVLVDLMKDSKRWAAAVFIGSVAFLNFSDFFGPKPKADLHWTVICLAFLSGGFVATFVLQGLYIGLRAVSSATVRGIFSVPYLSGDEVAFLMAFAAYEARGGYHLDRVNPATYSRLDALEICERLDRRGLIQYNQFDTDIVKLSPKGRKVTQKLLRSGRVG
jgi:hypothetical protein